MELAAIAATSDADSVADVWVCEWETRSLFVDLTNDIAANMNAMPCAFFSFRNPIFKTDKNKYFAISVD